MKPCLQNHLVVLAAVVLLGCGKDDIATPDIPQQDPWRPAVWHRVTKYVNYLAVEALPAPDAGLDSIKTEITGVVLVAAIDRNSGGILVAYYYTFPPGFIQRLPATIDAHVSTRSK